MLSLTFLIYFSMIMARGVVVALDVPNIRRRWSKSYNAISNLVYCGKNTICLYLIKGASFRATDICSCLCEVSFCRPCHRGPYRCPRVSMCDGSSPEASRRYTVVPAELVKPPVPSAAWTSPPTRILDATERQVDVAPQGLVGRCVRKTWSSISRMSEGGRWSTGKCSTKYCNWYNYELTNTNAPMEPWTFEPTAKARSQTCSV